MTAVLLALLAAMYSVLPVSAVAGGEDDQRVPVSAVRSGEWWLKALGVERAWSVTRGAGVRIGIVDTGTDVTQPDLRDHVVVGGADFSGHGNASGTKPLNGTIPEHGTAIAAFAAGRGHGAGDKLGMIGVAPAASVLSVSVDTNPQIAQGIRWVVDHGAKVISLSFSSTNDPALAAAVAYAQAHDVVVVAAAGNKPAADKGGGGEADPAAYMGVVSVSGIDQNLASDPRSDFGFLSILAGQPVTSQSGGTAVVGPFSDGPTTTNEMVAAALSSQGSYKYADGTSYSTPVVAGIVALIRAKYPTMTAANVIRRLIHTSRSHNPSAPAGTWTAQQGFGVPDAYAALTTTTAPKSCENPLGSMVGKGSVGIWAAIVAKKTYVSSCSTSSSSPSSSPPASAAPSSASGTPSAPASAPSSSASASGSGSSGPGVWVWIVVVVAVLLVGGLVALVARRRGRPGGPGGPGGPAGPGSGPGGPANPGGPGGMGGPGGLGGPGGPPGGYPQQGPPPNYPPPNYPQQGPPPGGWQRPGYGQR